MSKVCRKGLHEFAGKGCPACKRAYMQTYISNYRQTEAGSATCRAAVKKYSESAGGRVAHKAAVEKYNKTQAGKTARYSNHNNRIRLDPQYRAEKQLRSREANVLRQNALSSKVVVELGCNGHRLRAHLESLFKPGMNWLNKGNTSGCWSIDHILPLSRFDLTIREEYLKAAHYTNLQPLWHVENLAKSNKLPDRP